MNVLELLWTHAQFSLPGPQLAPLEIGCRFRMTLRLEMKGGLLNPGLDLFTGHICINLALILDGVRYIEYRLLKALFIIHKLYYRK